MGTGKREQNAEKNREEIISRTVQLLLEKGSAGAASTIDICAAAGLTRPTLYHYFGSKRGLLLSVHQQLVNRDLVPIIEQAEAVEDPLERFIFMISSYTEHICTHPELRVLIHDTLVIKSDDFIDIREKWKKHYLLLKETIEQIFEKEKRSVSVKSSWMTLFLLGMQTWITYWFDFSRKESIQEIRDAAVSAALNLLGIGQKHGK